jgi:hypothetical protein
MDQHPRVKAGIVICFDDERRNFQSVMRVRETLGTLVAEGQLRAPLPVYVFIPTDKGLSALLTAHADRVMPLQTFGQIEQSASYRETAIPLLRRLAQDFQRAYDELQGDPSGSHSAPGDGKMTGAFRLSNEDAAAHAPVKLDAIGFTARRSRDAERKPEAQFSRGQVELLAQMEHNRYIAERLVSGWRYGPARDDRQKRRPSIRAWEDLADPTERGKDESQVRAMVRGYRAAGWLVERGRGDTSIVPSPTAASAQLPLGDSLTPGGTIR